MNNFKGNQFISFLLIVCVFIVEIVAYGNINKNCYSKTLKKVYKEKLSYEIAVTGIKDPNIVNNIKFPQLRINY